MEDRSQNDRGLAAECLRLAATTDDANSHAQYVALAQMWTNLAEEAENGRATFGRAQDVFNDAQILQQQQQKQTEKPEDDKS